MYSENHKSAGRSLCYALAADSFRNWMGVSAVWAARLSTQERAALAYAALKCLPPDQSRMVAESVFPGAGQPIPPLFNHADEAVTWAEFADLGELKAYALAAYERLPHADQVAFLDHVQGRAAA